MNRSNAYPASPCIKICKMDEAGKYCIGCKRTLEEIASWSAMSDVEKAAVYARIEKRKSEQVTV